MELADSAKWWIETLPDTFPLKVAYSQLSVAAVATLLVSVFALPVAAHAQPQGIPTVAQPVVQALPAPEAMRLNAALNRLARNPRDVAALIDAGEAAMALGDFEAAEGFFRRASETEPSNGRAKAGLASALALGGDPYSAIPLFEEAAKAGADVGTIAPERGLAYDLVGANALAQVYYRKALAGSEAGGKIRRRLALSLAIGGDGAAAEEMLLPLLRAQDKPAWRTRAFMLAILGRTREAVNVTNTLLPAGLAQHIVPYLRYMPQLTPAQQAAAANLGKFPRASEIGRDDPRIAAYSSLARPRAKVAAVDALLVPQGEPLGGRGKRASRRGDADSQSPGKSRRKSRAKREKRRKEQAEKIAQADEPRVAPPEPKPAREPAAVSRPTLASVAEKPVVQPRPAKTVTPSQSALAKVSAAQAPEQPATASTSSRGLSAAASPAPSAKQPAAVVRAGPGFDLAKLPSGDPSSTATATPAPPASNGVESALSVPAQAEEADFTELFGDLGKPVAQPAPEPGGVDVRKIESAELKLEPEKPPPKPARPSHPSRIWVQLGIGQKITALKFDWRRLNRHQAALFKGRKAYVSDLGRTNRMLTGPFGSRKAAKNFLANLAKVGLDGPYMWISRAGQVVDQISN